MMRSVLFLACLFLMASVVSCKKPEAEKAVKPAPPVNPKGNMVLIPGGKFMMGGDAGEMDGDSDSHQTAYPIHPVEIDPFWIDETEVTNAQFKAFVDATGYKTFAEKPLPAATVKELQAAAQANLI
ncbi:MAG: formylglycine-generating enzyme family protein, partial [Verrucomicrobiota bacterium]